MSVQTTRVVQLVPLEDYQDVLRRLEKAEQLIEQLDKELAASKARSDFEVGVDPEYHA